MNNASGDGEEAAIIRHTCERESPVHVREALTAKSSSETEFSEAAGGPQEVRRKGKIFEI